MRNFFKEVWESFTPSHWAEISNRTAGNGISFFSKVLLLAFVIMVLLAIPALVKMPKAISEQLGKFETLTLSGNFTMSSPIKLPNSEPLFVFDTSGAFTDLTSERVLVTQDKIFYRPFFGTHYVNTEQLKDLKNNSDNVKKFLAALVFLILPSIMFYAFVFVWLKYFLIIVTLSIILFVVLDLTHWRRTWKELFVVTCYASTLPVLAEVVVGAINPKLLIPVLSIAGLVQIYLIPAVVLALLSIGAAMCVYYNKEEEK